MVCFKAPALLYLLFKLISDVSLDAVCFDFQTGSNSQEILYYLLNFHLFSNATDSVSLC